MEACCWLQLVQTFVLGAENIVAQATRCNLAAQPGAKLPSQIETVHWMQKVKSGEPSASLTLASVLQQD